MEKEEVLASLYRQRLEILNCVNFLKASKKIEGFELVHNQLLIQREAVIFKIRKEDDEKKIFRLQGRLDQIEELFSFEEKLQMSLQSIEKRINEISKGMKNG